MVIQIMAHSLVYHMKAKYFFNNKENKHINY